MDEPRPPSPPRDSPLLLPEIAPLRILFLGLSLVFLNLSLQVVLEAALPGIYPAVLLATGLSLIAIPVWLVRRTGVQLGAAFRTRALPANQFFWVTLLTFALILPVELMGELSQRLVPMPESVVEMFERLRPSGPTEWALAAFTLCAIVPVGEELVFRGTIQQVARESIGGIPAAILCGLLFAAMHFAPWHLGGLALLGLVLGLVFERTGSLLACIWMHAVYNAIVITVTAFGSGIRPWEEYMLPLTAVSALTAWFCWRRLRTVIPWDDARGESDEVR